MDSLVEKLKAIGMSDLPIQKLVTTKSKLGLSDDDPLILLLVELESYLRLYETIPEKITISANLAVQAAKKKIEAELISNVETTTRNASKFLMKTIKIKKLESISYAATTLSLVIALTIFLTQPILTAVPQWLVELNRETNIPHLDHVWSVLNTPTYVSAVILLASGFVLKIFSRNWFRFAKIQKKAINQ